MKVARAIAKIMAAIFGAILVLGSFGIFATYQRMQGGNHFLTIVVALAVFLTGAALFNWGTDLPRRWNAFKERRSRLPSPKPLEESKPVEPSAGSPVTLGTEQPSVPPAIEVTMLQGAEPGPEASPEAVPRAAPSATSGRQSHHGLMWLLSGLLVVVLIAVGVLVWRSLALSDKVADLSVALTTTTSASSITTTMAGPWSGYSKAGYIASFNGVSAVRSQAWKDWSNANSSGPVQYLHQGGSFGPVLSLVRDMPECPPEMRQLQDAYYNALSEWYSVLKAYGRASSASQSNLEMAASAAERQAFQSWKLAVDGLR